MRKSRRFWLAMLCGVFAGAGIALAIALWVAALPVPRFAAKYRTDAQDAIEATQTANWNPNHLFWPERPMPPMPVRSATKIESKEDAHLEADLPIQAASPRNTAALPLIESRLLPSADAANKVIGDLRNLGLQARLVRRGPDVLVRMGPFDDPQEAERAKQALVSTAGPGVTVRPLE